MPTTILIDQMAGSPDGVSGAYLKLIHASTVWEGISETLVAEKKCPLAPRPHLSVRTRLLFQATGSLMVESFLGEVPNSASCLGGWFFLLLAVGRVLEKPTGSKRVLARMADVQCQTACISHGRFFQDKGTLIR